MPRSSGFVLNLVIDYLSLIEFFYFTSLILHIIQSLINICFSLPPQRFLFLCHFWSTHWSFSAQSVSENQLVSLDAPTPLWISIASLSLCLLIGHCFVNLSIHWLISFLHTSTLFLSFFLSEFLLSFFFNLWPSAILFNSLFSVSLLLSHTCGFVFLCHFLPYLWIGFCPPLHIAFFYACLSSLSCIDFPSVKINLFSHTHFAYIYFGFGGIPVT